MEDETVKGIKILALATAALAVFTGATSTFAIGCVSLPTAWYVEGDFGTSSQSGKTYGTNTTSSSSGTGWNANAGYKFMPYFAIDAGVTSYANTNVKAQSTSTTFAQDRHWSYNLAAKGILPLGESGAELFAKLGVTKLYASTKVTDSGTEALTGFNSQKNNSTSYFVGAGGNYFFMPTLGASVQWNRAKGNSQTGVQDYYGIGLILLVY